MLLECFSCHKKFEIDDSTVTIQRSDECPLCSAPMRCCKMCDFYDPASYNECHETMAERIREKDKPNFCNYFRIAKEGNKHTYDKNTFFDAADALFKKKIS